MDQVAAFEAGLRQSAADYRPLFDGAHDEPALRAANARFVGPNGELTRLMKLMPALPGERRRELGKRANELKNEIQSAFAARLAALANAARSAELSGPHLDASLPGRGQRPGRLHPLTRVKHELLDIFMSMGFDVADGPEVNLHEYNFDKLGFPPDHPATDMQDTFFVAAPDGGANARSVLLRTHTSTVQVREMLRRKPPLAVVSAGATFRRDDDATHSPMFMQLEGFMVDEGVSFAHLKGVLTHFLRRLFGQDAPVRFRPSYFPFVEPGGEVDVGCTICRRFARPDAPDCRVCKNTGFIEILGCGMIHPVVFEHVGYDPERYTGFAFGMGLDRVTMIRHGIPHLGMLYANDPRFLQQISGKFMLASHAWLEELIGAAIDPVELAARLTSAGIEVDAVHRYGDALEAVVIAEVRSQRPHPKREKLSLVTVFDGQGEQEVVCGASNVPPPGGRVVLAQLGTKLPNGIVIAERELAGVVSRGMLCSERELDAGDDESGILVLDAAMAATPGSSAARALGLRDTVYELSLTPNRADCLGHIGLARELCVLFDRAFAWPMPPRDVRIAASTSATFPQRESAFSLELGQSAPAGDGFANVRVDIRAGERCPRYGAALVSGVAIGPSPFWLRHRLHRLGLRAISNVVDVTNYVLLLFGHPIHAFDYDRLRGGRIEVRLARAGESMRTLDGHARVLSADDLLICDGEGPVALAGVMGGENSEIAASTQRVLIECAYFDPRSVRRTSKRTGLHTDSSHRFERGVDTGDIRHVLAHAAAWIAALGSGVVVADALDVVAQALPAPRIRLRTQRIEQLLGRSFDGARVERLLRGLGCTIKPSADGLEVVAPGHRPDLGREVDLIEELARLFGYDSLPSVTPRIAPSPDGTPATITFVRALRNAAAAAGLDEAINYAFIAPEALPRARAPELALRILNPMSEERSAMRTSLLPGLADNLRQAQRTQQKRFAAFELARVFHPRAGELLPEERLMLGVLCWGQRGNWYDEREIFDFYDVKAALEAIVRPIAGRVPETGLDPELERISPELHPRRSARVRLGDSAIGCLGELHPDVVAALDLEGRPIWAVLDVEWLARAIAALGPVHVSATPRFPSSTRDVAVIVPEAAVAGEIAAALRGTAGPLAEAVTLFDIYRGDSIPADHKSLAFHVVYRDAEATLTDKVVDELHEKVARTAEERFSGSIRR